MYLVRVKPRTVRLNKYIAESGYCSRRQADQYIESGQVKINGRRAKIADVVRPGQQVMVNGFLLDPIEDSGLVFIALNKPVGVTSTTESHVENNIVQWVNHPQRIFPIGRLDKDSQGLIFLTNDGDVVNKILRAGNRHEKEYVVTVDKPLTDQAIRTMSQGVPMLGSVTKKCQITQEAPRVFRITLIQGLNRQIRRMCEYVGLQVVKLERVRIMHIRLGDIPEGEWRDLTEQELDKMYTAVEGSSKENEKKKPSGSKSKISPKSKSSAKHKPQRGGKPKHVRSKGKVQSKGRGKKRR